jgi:hypothetical protein
MMSDKNDKKLSDLIKIVKERALEIIGTITILSTAIKLIIEPSRSFVYAIAVALGSVILLSLLYICMAKRPSRTVRHSREPRFTRKQRYAALMGLVVLPLLAAAWIVIPLPRAKCPPIQLIFTPFTESAEANAIRINLMNQIKKNIDVHADLSEKSTPGVEVAKEYAKSKNVQIVVWGEVVNRLPLLMHLHVVMGEKCGLAEDRLPRGFEEVKSAEKDYFGFHLEVFKKSNSGKDTDLQHDKEAADFINLVTGIAFYQEGRWDEALAYFRDVKHRLGAYYEGLAYEQLSRRSDPIENLKKAWQAYQKFCGPDWECFIAADKTAPGSEANSNKTDEEKELEATAVATYINASNTILKLSELGDKKIKEYVESSYNGYNKALALYEQLLKQDNPALDKEWKTAAQNNLAVAKTKLAEVEEPSQRTAWLKDAETDFNDILGQSAQDSEEWMTAKWNLGSLAFDQSRAIEDSAERTNKLQQAAATFREMLQANASFVACPLNLTQWLRATGQMNAPEDKAELQYNLGLVYAELAKDASGEAALMYLDGAEMLFRNAGKIYMQEDNSLDLALNNRARALVLIEQSHWRKNRAKALLKQASDIAGNALEVYDRKASPRDWAITTATRAYANRELSKTVADQTEKLELLNNAVELSHESEQVLREIVDHSNGNQQTLIFPLEHARAQYEYGNSCYELGLANADRSLIDEAIRAYTDALSVWISYGFHYDRSRTEGALEEARKAL